MLYMDIIAFYSQIHTKHIITACGQKVTKTQVGGTLSARGTGLLYLQEILLVLISVRA